MDRILEIGDRLLRQDARLGRRRVEQQHTELVAAEAGDKVRRVREPNLQTIGDGAQQDIAGRVSEPVVDRLEVVEIEEQHRRQVAALQLLADPRQEVGTVRETGQRIVIGAVAELPLECAIGGDIAQRQHDARDRDVGHQVDCRQLHRATLAVGVQRGHLDRQRALGRQLVDVVPTDRRACSRSLRMSSVSN